MNLKDYNTELYHWGIKGQKWGVRRYQNADGTLTNAGKKRYAKDLRVTAERAAKVRGISTDATTAIKGKVGKQLTESEVASIHSKHKKWMELETEAQANEAKIDAYAVKVGKKLYDEEMKRNGDAYPTEKDKYKLMEYCTYDDGYSAAEKDHPDWFKAEKAASKAYDEYMAEVAKATDRLLGSYGNMPAYSIPSIYGGQINVKLNSAVKDAIGELERDKWKAERNVK